MEVIRFNSKSFRYKALSNFAGAMIYWITADQRVMTFFCTEVMYQWYHASLYDRLYASYLLNEATSEFVRSGVAEDGARRAKLLGGKGAYAAWAKATEVHKTKAAAIKCFDAATKEWYAQNVKLMAHLTYVKFYANPDLLDVLASTRDARLFESGRGNGIWVAAGGNMMGRILMAVRSVHDLSPLLIADTPSRELSATPFVAQTAGKIPKAPAAAPAAAPARRTSVRSPECTAWLRVLHTRADEFAARFVADPDVQVVIAAAANGTLVALNALDKALDKAAGSLSRSMGGISLAVGSTSAGYESPPF